MTGFPWFPIGHAIASGTVGRLRAEGPGYQVLQDQAGDALILILAAGERAAVDARQIAGASRFAEAECAYRGRRPRCPAHGDHVIRSMTTGRRTGLTAQLDLFSDLSI